MVVAGLEEGRWPGGVRVESAAGVKAKDVRGGPSHAAYRPCHMIWSLS